MKSKIISSLSLTALLALPLATATDLTWDHDADGTASDGGGTWLNANQWLDGVTPATWNNATPDNATFGSGGGSGTMDLDLTGDVTAGTVLFDNYSGTYRLNSGILSTSGGTTIGPNAGNFYSRSSVTITGAGGFTMNSPGLANIRESTLTYTGPTVVNAGVVMFFHQGTLPTGNFTLNNGTLTDYYRRTHTFNNGLGTGTEQIQIYGDSGFGSGNGNGNWRIGANNSTLQWGSTHFNPTSLRLRAPLGDNNGPGIYGQVSLQNGLDLNGGARTIWVNGGNGPDYKNPIQAWGKINASLSDTAGGGSLIKTGGGTLFFGAANTYDGGTTVNGGWILYDDTNRMPSTGNHAFNDGSGLWVRVGSSGGRFTAASSGAGSLGGLLSGTGPGTSTTSFSGNVDLIIEPNGGPDYAGSIPATIRDVSIHNGDMTLSGTNSFTGRLSVGLQEQNQRVVTLGSTTAIPSGADVKVDTKGTGTLDLNGFDATVGQLQLGSNNGGQQGTVTGTGSTLTVTAGVLLDSHNDGGGRVSCDTLDLNGATQTFTHNGNNRATPDLIIDANVQNGGVTTNATGGQSEIYLNGTNTYTGGTTHEAGRLRINGSLADATMSITGGDVAGTGSLTFNIVGAAVDQVVTSGGSIDISGMTCNVLGTPTVAEYILVDATGSGSYSGTFASSTLPAGYVLDYGTANIVKIVGTPGGSPFDTWAGTGTLGAVTFDGDTNGDGVQDGLAFLLGVGNPDDDATGSLPTVSETGGGLVMNFNCLPSADRGTAELRVEHSSDLGVTDAWTATVDEVPDADDAVLDNDVTFVVTGPSGSPSVNDVTATIGSAAAAGGKLFGRLTATE